MISLATFVKNEAHCIGYMFQSVLPFINEIVVVDTGSTDNTLQICRKLGARVYETKFTDFGKLRTLTAHLCRQPWVLMLDADETLDNANGLKKLAQSCRSFAYAFPRKRWLDIGRTRQTELDAYPDYQVRFFMNNPNFVWKREVHEYFDGCAVEEVKENEGFIINHFQDIFRDEQRKRERDELYQRLAQQAGVNAQGGKPV